MDSGTATAIALRPFIMIIFMIVIVVPLSWLILKMIPEGKVKRFLTRKIDNGIGPAPAVMLETRRKLFLKIWKWFWICTAITVALFYFTGIHAFLWPCGAAIFPIMIAQKIMCGTWHQEHLD